MYEEAVEDSLDGMTMHDLQQQDEIDRSIKIPATENPSNFNLTLPSAAERALTTFGFDANGNPSFSLPSVIGPNFIDWTVFTPSGSWASNCNYTGVYRRIGSTMDVLVSIAIMGAVNAVALNINIPFGLNIDATKMPGMSDLSRVVGIGAGNRHSTRVYGFSVKTNFLNLTSVFVQNLDQEATQNSVDNTNPVTWGNLDTIDLKFSVPILGWS
jgi:hypothetical protein